MPLSRLRRPAAGVAAVLTAVAFGACGGSNSGSSSKPQYCQDRQTLKNDISKLSSVDVVSNGLNALEAQLRKVRSDAKALVASAKQDFPQQTSAINSSVDTLQASIGRLGSSPSVQDLTSLAGQVSAVADAIKSFDTATKDKCS